MMVLFEIYFKSRRFTKDIHKDETKRHLNTVNIFRLTLSNALVYICVKCSSHVGCVKCLKKIYTYICIRF